MPWVKLDDGFYDNRTNRALGPAARDLFIAGLCYCAKGLTDGIIAKHDLPLILAQAQAKPRLVRQLVDAGRWLEAEDHYEVAEYLTYQFSRARVEAEREASRERQRRARSRGASASHQDAAGRFTSHSRSNGVTGGVSAAVGHPLPDPTRPPLDTSSSGSTVPTPRPNPEADDGPTFGTQPPERIPDANRELALTSIRELRRRTPPPDDAA